MNFKLPLMAILLNSAILMATFTETGNEAQRWQGPTRFDKVQDRIESLKAEFKEKRKELERDHSIEQEKVIDGLEISGNRLIVRGDRNPELFTLGELLEESTAHLFSTVPEVRQNYVRALFYLDFPPNEVNDLAWVTREPFSTYFNRNWYSKIRRGDSDIVHYTIAYGKQEWALKAIERLSPDARKALINFALIHCLPNMTKEIPLLQKKIRIDRFL